MGHRASYAIRRKGEVKLFYSHWGALSVPEDVFWGPTFAERFIEQNEAADSWLDDVWAEGGAALDFDEKRCAFFGGERIGYGPSRELALALMRVIWGKAGWTIDWVDSVCGVAECVGVPGASVKAAMIEPLALTPESAQQGIERGFFGTLVTRRGDGAVDDRVAGATPGEVLAAGPGLLEWLEELTPLSEAAELQGQRPKHDWEDEKRALGQEIASGVDIDEASRTITVSFGKYAFPDDRLMGWLGERWPGWTLVRRDHGLEGHFAHQDREPPALLGSLKDPWADHEAEETAREATKTRDEILGEIVEALFGERSDPVAFAKRAVASTAQDSEGGVTWTHPSLFVSPPDGRPAPDTAKTLFSLALEALGNALASS